MKSIKCILVPTDFSDNSRAAFEYALSMAEDMKASVKVVHIYSDYTPDMPLADPSSQSRRDRHHGYAGHAVRESLHS